MRLGFLMTVSSLTASLLVGLAPARAEEPMRLYAAGSLHEAMTELLAASGLATAEIAPPIYGSAGTLRERIEQGAGADILASADMAQAERLAREHGDRPVVLFARNRMCAVARRSVGLTQDNFVERMLDPKVRIATSTPGSDPSGDYTFAIFARAEAVHPGAKAILDAKAQKLFGNPSAKPLVPGHSLPAGAFLADRADMTLTYCTGAPALVKELPELVSMPVPESVAVHPDNGLVTLTENAATARFVVFVMSQRGQEILARNGFTPVTLEAARP